MADSIVAEEVWRSIPGYEPYSASSFGQIRRDDGPPNWWKQRAHRPILKPYINPRNGYAYICVCLNGRPKTTRAHKLVALAFIGPRPDGMQINHIDGDKTNNAASNLEYVTQSENMIHAFQTGLQVAVRGEQSSCSKLSASDVLEIMALEGRMTHRAIGAMFGITRKSVSAIFSGSRWRHLTGRTFDGRNRKLGRPCGGIHAARQN